MLVIGNADRSQKMVAGQRVSPVIPSACLSNAPGVCDLSRRDGRLLGRYFFSFFLSFFLLCFVLFSFFFFPSLSELGKSGFSWREAAMLLYYFKFIVRQVSSPKVKPACKAEQDLQPMNRQMIILAYLHLIHTAENLSTNIS